MPTPYNNPYIPGDPYSYDLKWVVEEIDKFKLTEDAVQRAQDSADAASGYADDASGYADDARGYANDAATSAGSAYAYEQSAKNYADHIADPVSGLVSDWLNQHITQPTTPAIDTSLTVAGAAADAKVTGDELKRALRVYSPAIGAGNYSTVLPDLNNVDENVVYFFLFGDNTPQSQLPAHMPEYPYMGTVNVLINYCAYPNQGTWGDFQIYFAYSKVWRRRKENGTTWGNWFEVGKLPYATEIYVGSTRTYTTLDSAAAYSRSHPGTTLYLDAEDFDIIAEKGSAFWNTSYNVSTGAIIFGDNTKVIGKQGTRIICNYTGSNTTIPTYVSPIFMQTANFYMENVEIYSRNTRYAFHHEGGNGYHEFKLKNCHFDHANTLISGYRQALGGGLGEHGLVTIEGGYYKSNVVGNNGVISYHNRAVAGAKSIVYIKDAYIDNPVSNQALIRAAYHGGSTEVTPFYISNCSMGAAPVVNPEATGDTIVNVQTLVWGSTIRP